MKSGCRKTGVFSGGAPQLTAAVLFCLGISCLDVAVMPVAAMPASHRLPVSPNEISAGLQVGNEKLTLSRDGRWLVFSTTKGTIILNVQTGEMFNPPSGLLMSGDLWSPQGATIIAVAQKEGRHALTLWKAGQPEETRRDLLTFPRRMSGPAGGVIWSGDGKYVYFVLHQSLPWQKSHPSDDNPPAEGNNVYLEMTTPYFQEKRRSLSERSRSFIVGMEVSTGKWGVIAKGNDIQKIYLSPNGRRLIAVQLKTPPEHRKELEGQVIGDLYVVDVPEFSAIKKIDLETVEDRKAGWSNHKGERISPALQDVFLNNASVSFDPPFQAGTGGNLLVVWSPDSERFAFATVGRRSSGDVFVYDLASRQTRNLTEGVTLGPWGKSLGFADEYLHSYNSPKFGYAFPPLWMPDGSGLLIMGRGDVWSIPLNGVPRILTRDVPEEVRKILDSPSRNTVSADAAGNVTFIAKDKQTRQDSVYKLNPVTGEAGKIADTGVWMNWRLAASPGADLLYYIGTGETSAPNVYSLGLREKSAPSLVTKYKLELADRIFPELRKLSWKTPEAKAGYGLLYLPPGASSSSKMPLILDGYPGQAISVIDQRAKYGASFYDDRVHALLADGFAVFLCDVPMSDFGVYAQPMKQMVDGVNAAVDAALATGVVDGARMGIMGSSYGGVMVNAVVTRTNRFKAAASISGLSNWFADYMGGGDASGTSYHERGQARFGKPLWEDPQRYVENSPITYWNKVATPLLIVHGELDDRVVMRHAEESFRGLDHLNRENIVLARYRRMYHGYNVEADRRIRGWFREHLLGAKPAVHLADQGSFMLGGSQGGAEDGSLAPRTPAPVTTPVSPPPAPTPQQ